ncbi:chaperone protein dnaJ 20, chloroplastic-like [Alnus glutinosa]|uniref:chaperone protein dnaJ 20, chloroplastic-like n=1 Tax=Alnus glutinosa TaxID=3517 RepID=UPI002D7A374B|nr:chaperone protein dnaJ 20, chloroplastic-like [Alnus glutinosa]
MDVVLSSRQSIAKPFLALPLPNKRQQPPAGHVCISCRATKVGGEKNSTSTLYELLSLNTNKANVKEIKKAYRSMALRYHPDLCPPSMKEESSRIFVLLNEAYTTLSDPVLRREYDSQLGLGNFGKTLKMDSTNDHVTRSRWQEQILELKRRSGCRMAEKEGSWGSRIRAQNMRKNE